MNLSRKLAQEYWTEVRRLLQTEHRLSATAAARGVKVYRALLAQNCVGEFIYHSSVEDTAVGIISGDYAALAKSRATQSTRP